MPAIGPSLLTRQAANLQPSIVCSSEVVKRWAAAKELPRVVSY